MSTLEPIEDALLSIASSVADAHTKPHLATNLANSLSMMGYPSDEVARAVALFFQQYNKRPA